MLNSLRFYEQAEEETSFDLYDYLFACVMTDKIPIFYGFKEFQELFEQGFIIGNYSIISIYIEEQEYQIKDFSCLVTKDGYLQELKEGVFLDSKELLGNENNPQSWSLVNFDLRPYQVVH